MHCTVLPILMTYRAAVKATMNFVHRQIVAFADNQNPFVHLHSCRLTSKKPVLVGDAFLVGTTRFACVAAPANWLAANETRCRLGPGVSIHVDDGRLLFVVFVLVHDFIIAPNRDASSILLPFDGWQVDAFDGEVCHVGTLSRLGIVASYRLGRLLV